MKLSILFLIGLTACSTTYDLKHKKPVLSYETSKSADQVMKCVRDKWREHMNPVEEMKTNHGWLVRHFDTLPSDTKVVVTIERENEKTSVKYFHKSDLFKITRAQDEVKSCK